jgi:hypothetical protein
MIDKGITYDQLLSDINALPSTPSADQLATYDLTGDGVLDAGDARYHIASQPLQQLSPSYLGAGVNLVEDQRGEMVPQAVQDVLQMAVGSQDPDMRYDSNNDGEITSSDALGFLKYAEQQNYDDASGFMGNFYASELPSQGPTPDDGLRDIMNQSGTGLSGGSLEDIMNRPRPELGDGMYTTMAMGEEDGGNPFLPAPPPVGVSPPIDIKPPVPIPRPDNPFLNPGPPVGIDPPPPVGGTAPFNPFPQLPTGGQGGRTYGNYQDQFPAEMLAQTSTAKGPFS